MDLDPDRIAHLERHARTASFAAAALFALSLIALVAGAGSTPMESTATSLLVIIPVTLLLGVLAAGSYAWALRSEIRSTITENEAAGVQ